MNFKELVFADSNAQRVYDNYIKSIKNVVKPISKKEQQEVLMEFNSHIYEHLQNNKSKNELDSLLNAIDKLGSPEIVLKPLVADKLLERATKTFNPIHVFQALVRNVGNGISYIIFFFLYTFLGTFVFLIFAKLFKGDDVGMWYNGGEFVSLGMISGISDQSGYREVLGYWFIPVMILVAITLYFLITLLLKLKRSFNKKLQS